ncbi:type VI secretion system baseplate subunit TssF [Silvanigrella aquatica]|uniref:Type VI secretion system protein ImpG n=1 Tax=Silvanigrella aquatica TaxID=1915309 RepID=A0A1L4CZ03_9BACT|nr:type VI secretion system baseplate subunit TssF [Silvanigrella aquatica]APJ03193.1 hypothetical protein AXG55_04460 [Silvanigrella aquatica]
MTSNYSNQNFLKLYLNSLDNLRTNGRIFSQQNPDLAPYLDLSYRKSNDPETERLIESFAYMFAQVEHKSILAQNDYALNFIDHLFPELVSPLPALTVLKVTPEKSYFTKDKLKFIVPKSTLFSAKNQNGVRCQFTSCQESQISPIHITQSQFIDSSLNKENIGKNKKALAISFETSIHYNVSNQNPLNLSLYIDSDFYSVISIYDALFSSHKPMLLQIDSDSELWHIPKENLKPLYYLEAQDHNKNTLYPLFDYLNYYQKYFFLELKVTNNISFKNKFKIIIPLSENIEFISNLGSSFLQTNCVPAVNLFEHKMQSVKYLPEKQEYLLRTEGNTNEELQVIKLNSVMTYDAQTGEHISLNPFYQNSRISQYSKQNLFNNIVWASKRSFNNSTLESGSYHLRLLSKFKATEEKAHWPEYLYPSGLCTNTRAAENIKPYSEFQCHSYSLPIAQSCSLFWPKYYPCSLNHTNNIEVLKLLFKINQEILSAQIINTVYFIKTLDILAPGISSVKNLFIQILEQSIGFIAEETIRQQMRNKQTFHIPSIVYKIQFLQKDGFPRGIHFYLNFLNEYFNYIRDFNFLISFEAVLV